MTLGEYLRLHLTADPAVSAQVVKRVWSELLPQRPDLPALTFTVVSGDRDVTLDGWHGVAAQRVEVSSWASTRAAASALAAAVLAAMGGHRGAAGGFEVQGVVLLMESWDYEPETKLYRVLQDYEIHTAG